MATTSRPESGAGDQTVVLIHGREEQVIPVFNRSLTQFFSD